MFQFIRNWLDSRIIKRSTITSNEWDRVFAMLPLLHGLTVDEKRSLRELAILFLDDKSFSGASDLVITQQMGLIIALQACLPLLNLGIRRYKGWYSVIVYPSGFAPERVVRDEYGVEHHVQSSLSGEAWLHGPVILSWDDTEHAGIIDGENSVLCQANIDGFSEAEKWLAARRTCAELVILSQASTTTQMAAYRLARREPG
jgi:hypothetical protein